MRSFKRRLNEKPHETVQHFNAFSDGMFGVALDELKDKGK